MTASLPDGDARVSVMIVDDSALTRKLLTQVLSRDKGIIVADTAMDGQFALDHLRRMRPDVILLDVDMPRLDGLATLERIVADYRIPVVMCSAKTTTGAQAAIDALSRGAVDIIAKPSLEALTSGQATAEIVAKVRNAAGSRILPAASRPRSASRRAPIVSPPATPVRALGAQLRASQPKILAVGTSTGGPPAIEQVLAALPADFPIPIVIVQHMPEGFTAMLASRLDSHSRLRVSEARDGEIVGPGDVRIAAGGAHLRAVRTESGFVLKIDRETPPVSGHRPSVDVLFESLASTAGADTLALMMTGMGSDGAAGAAALAARGANVIAQSPETCVCHGMPKSVIDRGLARTVVPLGEIASVLTAAVASPNRSRPKDG